MYCTVIHVLLYMYCYTCTVLLYCMYMYCYTCTVIHVLLYMYCYTCTVLLYMYCYTCTVLLYMYCTVIHVLLYMYCTVIHDCTVIHVLLYCSFILSVKQYTEAFLSTYYTLISSDELIFKLLIRLQYFYKESNAPLWQATTSLLVRVLNNMGWVTDHICSCLCYY